MNENYGAFGLLGDTWSLVKQFLRQKWKLVLSLLLIVAWVIFGYSILIKKDVGGLNAFLILFGALILYLLASTEVSLEMGKLYGCVLPGNDGSFKYLLKKSLVFGLVCLLILILTTVLLGSIVVGVRYVFSEGYLSINADSRLLLIFSVLSMFISVFIFCFLWIFSDLYPAAFFLTDKPFSFKFFRIGSTLKLLNKKKGLVFFSSYFLFVFKFGIILAVPCLMIIFLDPVAIKMLMGRSLFSAFPKLSSVVTVTTFLGFWIITKAYGVVLFKYLCNLEKK